MDDTYADWLERRVFEPPGVVYPCVRAFWVHSRAYLWAAACDFNDASCSAVTSAEEGGL